MVFSDSHLNAKRGPRELTYCLNHDDDALQAFSFNALKLIIRHAKLYKRILLLN